jgi:hypothetical protein
MPPANGLVNTLDLQHFVLGLAEGSGLLLLRGMFLGLGAFSCKASANGQEFLPLWELSHSHPFFTRFILSGQQMGQLFVTSQRTLKGYAGAIRNGKLEAKMARN